MQKPADVIFALAKTVEFKLECGVPFSIKKLTLNEAKEMEAKTKEFGITEDGEGDTLGLVRWLIPKYVLDAENQPIFTEDQVGDIPIDIINEISTAFQVVNQHGEEDEEAEKN